MFLCRVIIWVWPILRMHPLRTLLENCASSRIPFLVQVSITLALSCSGFVLFLLTFIISVEVKGRRKTDHTPSAASVGKKLKASKPSSKSKKQM